ADARLGCSLAVGSQFASQRPFLLLPSVPSWSGCLTPSCHPAAVNPVAQRSATALPRHALSRPLAQPYFATFVRSNLTGLRSSLRSCQAPPDAARKQLRRSR